MWLQHLNVYIQLLRSLPYVSCKKIPKEPKSTNFKKVNDLRSRRYKLNQFMVLCKWNKTLIS